MGRHKSKIADPKQATEELVTEAVINFGEPYDDREGRDTSLPTLRSVAEEMGTTILRVRKLLITGGVFTTTISRAVQEMVIEGKSVGEIMETLKLSKASVYSYLPYKDIAFNLPEAQRSSNADRHRTFRARKKAADALQADPSSVNLWKAVILFRGYPFSTSGRGAREGVKFKYTVSKGGPSGRKYEGEEVEGWGNEIIIEGREKSITRSSVDYALKIALEGEVAGPKSLKIYGSSYVWAIFRRFGLV